MHKMGLMFLASQNGCEAWIRSQVPSEDRQVVELRKRASTIRFLTAMAARWNAGLGLPDLLFVKTNQKPGFLCEFFQFSKACETEQSMCTSHQSTSSFMTMYPQVYPLLAQV